MIGAPFFARWIRAAGGDSRAAALLHQALTTNHHRLLDARLEKTGLDRGTVLALAGLGVAVYSVATAALVWVLRERVDLAANVLIIAQTGIIVLLCVQDMLNGLLGVEIWRTVGSWPVSSQTFLFARLIQPTRRALLISLVVCAPSILVMMVFHGIPVLTGLVMVPICFIVALSVIWSAAAVLTIVMVSVRPEMIRAVFLLGFLAISMLPALLMTILPPELAFHARNLFFLPTYWLAALPHATVVGSIKWFGTGVAGIAVWSVTPIIVLRRTARWYTLSLGRIAVRSKRARGAWLARLLTFGSRKSIHFVYGQIILAQARGDWWFQAQLAAMPVIFILFAVYLVAGLDLSAVFSSPFIHESRLHPVMFIIVAVGIPPILSLPTISQSVDYKASWMLRAGIHNETDFRNASRRYVRLIFAVPILLLLTIGYLVHRVPIHEVAAHIFMLFMITEAMVAIVQTQFPGYPFSLPPQDEEMGIKMAVIIVLYEVQCVMMAMLVYHVLYRWWWAYAAAVLLFGVLAFRREPLTKRCEENA